MSTLHAGYFVGEFGWLLMRWQGLVRHVAQNYDKVVIGCEYEYRHLFEDFATEFIFFDGEIVNRNMWMANGNIYPLPVPSGENVLYPCRELCMCKSIHQDFIKYGTPDKSKEYDLLIHARYINYNNTEHRNIDGTTWTNLISALPSKMRIGTIGANVGGNLSCMYIPGTDDLRNIELKELCDIMASSKLLISPSSGPVHLASLCGLNHLVWTDDKYQGVIGGTNKERYETIWNPLKTPCTVLDDTWTPDINTIEQEVYKCLLFQ